MSRIQRRTAAPREVQALVDSGVDPLLARIYCARGVAGRAELEYDLAGLLPPSGLKGADEAATLLADAIEAGARMLIVADYDCDGATACAVGLRALRAFGADVAYLVPNRFEYGYGLTPAIVDLAVPLQPELLITVDNGIASVDGVAAARAASMATLITDHHLPATAQPRGQSGQLRGVPLHHVRPHEGATVAAGAPLQHAGPAQRQQRAAQRRPRHRESLGHLTFGAQPGSGPQRPLGQHGQDPPPHVLGDRSALRLRHGLRTHRVR